MNISATLGLVLAVAVFLSTVFLAVGDASLLLDMRSMIIVGGGTFAAVMIAFPIREIFHLVFVFIKGVLGGAKKDYLGLIEQVSGLSRALLRGKRHFEAAIPHVRDPFLKDGS